MEGQRLNSALRNMAIISAGSINLCLVIEKHKDA